MLGVRCTKKRRLCNGFLVHLCRDLEHAVVADLKVEKGYPAQSLQLHHGTAIVQAAQAAAVSGFSSERTNCGVSGVFACVGKRAVAVAVVVSVWDLPSSKWT
jgi:hypothetical protein